jgi:hypothetical protein
MERFYLGTHQPHWLASLSLAGLDEQVVPLFVSHRRLAGRRRLPRACRPWALDSGGFTELSLFGEWTVGPGEYVAAVYRYQTEIGLLDWAAPQDWMCEPEIRAVTGLTVEDHQRRTVESFLRLRELWPGEEPCPIIPVLQGWSTKDYLRCAAWYERAGVDLAAEPLVGVGSVCRRQHTDAIWQVFAALRGLPLHGFGVKLEGLRRYSDGITSADSLAWSWSARADGRAGRRTPGCRHSSCVNCSVYAAAWYRRVMRTLTSAQLSLPLP